MGEPRIAFEGRGFEIVLELAARRAPRTAAYFLALVEAGAYDGTTIYRSTSLGDPEGPRLVQGGPLGAVLSPQAGAPRPAPPRFPLLPDFETTTESGLTHVAGTLSLARDLFDTGHAISEFFLCLGAFPALDAGGRSEPDERGFPAFGSVVEGLDHVAAIATRETGGEAAIARLQGEILTHPVSIRRAAVLSRSATDLDR
ncbi:MAG: peptidylprolyl isomerase [Myxococcota bacterium]|nr:peptidylprolyl isomerase [Myxococcota bacterium]